MHEVRGSDTSEEAVVMVVLDIITECFMNSELPSETIEGHEAHILSRSMRGGIKKGTDIPLHINLDLALSVLRNTRIRGMERRRRERIRRQRRRTGKRYGEAINED